MQRSTFRTFTYIVGFLGLIFVILLKLGKLGTTLGVVLCILFMLFGWAVTSKYSKYLIGEEQTEGSMG